MWKMSNWSKANAKKVVARTKGTKRGRKMIAWKKRRKPQYIPMTWKRPPTMTDGVVRCLYYMFSMDCTKEEACAMAHIAPSTFDAWYNWEYEILWKFKEVWFDVEGNATMVEHEMNAKFYEIIDHAIIQTYVSARQAQRKKKKYQQSWYRWTLQMSRSYNYIHMWCMYCLPSAYIKNLMRRVS